MMGLLETIMSAGSAVAETAGGVGEAFNNSAVNKMFNEGIFEGAPGGSSFGGQTDNIGAKHFMGFQQPQAMSVDSTSALQGVMSQVGMPSAASMLTPGATQQAVGYTMPQKGGALEPQEEENPYMKELEKVDQIEADANANLQGALYQPPMMNLGKPNTLAG